MHDLISYIVETFPTKMCRISCYVIVLVGLLISIAASPLRTVTNPLNNKALDLMVVVDESKPYMGIIQLGLLRTTLNSIALDFSPVGFGPYFGIYFYGGTTNIDNRVPFTTTSADAVKSALASKQLSATSSNPSTLSLALSTVGLNCASYCRANVPRVALLIVSNVESGEEAVIRQLERDRGLTVIIIGVGSKIDTSLLNRLASRPSAYYAMQVGDFYQLSALSSHISSVISEVSRQVVIGTPIHIPTLSSGLYHTLQINTAPYTVTSETMIMFAIGCPSCVVYSSASHPVPTSVNSQQSTVYRSFFAYTGYPSTLYYFRIPKGTSRIYVSLLGNGMNSVYITCDVFSVPQLMNINTRGVPIEDLSPIIG